MMLVPSDDGQMCYRHMICGMVVSGRNEGAKMGVQWAKMPFRPLLEKEAEKFVLYGVLSLLNRILGRW